MLLVDQTPLSVIYAIAQHVGEGKTVRVVGLEHRSFARAVADEPALGLFATANITVLVADGNTIADATLGGLHGDRGAGLPERGAPCG
jgi:hypothetical protein